MKKMLAVVAALVISVSAYAQIETPVKWGYVAKRTSPTEATIFLRATMQDGWHIYSQFGKDDGPIPTSFTFTPAKTYSLVGKTVEPKPITKYEKSFKMNVSHFDKEVIFQQKVKLKTPDATVIKGQLEYQVCNDIKCLPPETVNFTVQVSK